MLTRLTYTTVLLGLMLGSIAHAGLYSQYSNDPDNPHDPPIEKTDPRIIEWADTIVDYSPAPGVGVYVQWDTQEPMPDVGFAAPITGIGSLGDLYDPAFPPATGQIPMYSGATEPFGGDPSDTGDQYGFVGYDAPGTITVGFPRGIRNGTGPDFAVFENGPDYGSGLVADLAYVEVSSDGINFARFDSVSMNTEYLDANFGTSYASIDETNVYNLAGKHQDGWGTPFDLEELADHALVTAGQLDLQNVLYVRMVDIPGVHDGTYVDSLGNPVLDAWVTLNSGGFDFRLSEGVGVLHPVPEPGSMILLAAAGLSLGGLALRRRLRAGGKVSGGGRL
ncbi:MAG TPA: PEP-CTERM sorting domain-containing protein [Thermoguttaceae bacterium]|nr:PEP-CTERM sorting domain-containing protein [Thermoguttaceae bacterium]